MKYKLYYLYSISTNTVIYVGCTYLKLSERLRQHIDDSRHKSGRNQVKNYVIELLAYNIGIKMIRHAGSNLVEASRSELDAIREYYKNGHPITNSFKKKDNFPQLETI